ncbi:MAG: hypothetical protein ACR2IS_00775 [Nitrososphaeraceae archaeon]
MTIFNGIGNIHPDTEIECEYSISANCLEESIANDRRFERVHKKLNDDKIVTVIICHSCARQLWSQGELVAIQNNRIPTSARYEFVNNRLG